MLYLNTLTLSALNALTEEELNDLVLDTPISNGLSTLVPAAATSMISPINARQLAAFLSLFIALLLGT